MKMGVNAAEESPNVLAADWIFPITSSPLFRHAVVIQNGKIRQIRPIEPSDEMIPGVCLLPGLVNAHTHLAYTCFRNLWDDLPFFPWIRKLTETKQTMSDDQVISSTRQGIAECLRGGITTVADLCDWEPAAKMLSQSPLRGIFYWEIFGVEKEQAEKTWTDLNVLFERLHHKYSTARLAIGVSPHSCFTVRPDLYTRVGRWASDHHIPVSFHIAESPAELDFIQNRRGPIYNFLQERAADWQLMGRTPVEHLEGTGIFATRPLVAHAVQVNETDVQILQKHDVSIAHCPKSNAKFGHGVAPLKELLQTKMRVGIGTDSVASNNRFDLFEEARFTLLQQRATLGEMLFDEQQMLELITIGGARAMGLQDRIGSLEPGKEADVIAVQIPPGLDNDINVLRYLIHNASASDVSKTWISGELAGPDW